MSNNNITEKQVLDALSKVLDPEIKKDLVTLNMIRNVVLSKTADGTKVSLTLVLTTMACPLKAQIEEDVNKAVGAIEGVTELSMDVTAEVPQGRYSHEKQAIEGVKNIIAIASGKGGVGKSTVTVNLAIALAKSGAKVGIMDSDIYGPSVPLMMGCEGQLETTEAKEGQNPKMIPLETYGVKMVSVGFMLGDDSPLIWRGPMVMQMVNQFLKGVEWGELDYLLIDLPPGTGDAQLTLCQSAPISGAVIVTTPQDVATLDAKRALQMFKKVEVPILGIIENMSYFECPHCHEVTEIFSTGGGETVATKYGVPFLGKIPLVAAIREQGDSGEPIVSADPEGAVAKAFIKAAEETAAKVSVLALTNPSAYVPLTTIKA